MLRYCTYVLGGEQKHVDVLQTLWSRAGRRKKTLSPSKILVVRLFLLIFSVDDVSSLLNKSAGFCTRFLRSCIVPNILSKPIVSILGDRLWDLTLFDLIKRKIKLLPKVSNLMARLAVVDVSYSNTKNRSIERVYKYIYLEWVVGSKGVYQLAPWKKLYFTSFSGNEGLGGPGPPSSQTVPSNPSSLPSSSTATIQPSPSNNRRKKLSNGAIVAIAVANSVLLLVIVSFAVAYCCRRGSRDSSSTAASDSGKRRSSSYSGEKRVYAATASGGGGDSDATNATDKSKLVFFDRKKQFELEDLLRASAEMLGKGSLGTVYKAVLDDGSTVAVKRLKDANPCPRKEFEQYMDVIGKLRHHNVVRFRAYYYAREEKLLVYDYLPNGSLHSLLHGNRGPGRIPLDWTTRIGLVLGSARGLARIHEDYAGSRIPHGNVKSSNILLDKNGNACISDFGLSLLLNPTHAIARLSGYKAPEQVETKRLSQKADVYSFGVLLLEVLTGQSPSKCPSPTRGRARAEEEEVAMDLPKWVQSVVRDEWTAEVFDQELLRYKNIEEEMVSMLHIAMACVVAQPEKRPVMSEVVRMIEEIRVEQSPMGDDYDESRNSLSPSLATTEDALG
ncbi:hypothetical protein BUALT_Bualt11G0103300 [Buddleja alternifolia]|uniref:Protein kinase domain-containing protein n=1 Tax=Buddleja alternifolia TaxID=168488 RepID=A0AAV6WUW6_9LAMI|nr:hypothetical protein BUALT_Bualt11G0103300 [Buddleja alternifolia]